MALDTNLQSAFTAVGTAVKGKISNSEKGSPNGVATLDGTGKIPSAQLPSYVDDVVEFANLAAFPGTGSAGILYIALDTNVQYRWSGTVYVKITSGAVDSVAGKTGVVTLVKGDVGLGNVDNTSDAAKPISTDTQTALDLKVDKVAGKGLSTEDYTTTEKTKLAGITAGAQPNQNAFTSIAVSGQNTVLADIASDTLTLVAGTNISITTNDTSDTITINSTSNGITDISITHNATDIIVNSNTGADGTINAATTTSAGVMSAADKTKLNGVASGAQVNTVDSVAGKTGVVTLVKGDVGLGNVDNTSDINKPISNSTQSALDLKATSSSVTTLSNNIGSTSTNYVTVFNAALV